MGKGTAPGQPGMFGSGSGAPDRSRRGLWGARTPEDFRQWAAQREEAFRGYGDYYQDPWAQAREEAGEDWGYRIIPGSEF